MKQFYLIFLLNLGLIFNLPAQVFNLSPDAEVSIITGGPGKDLYALWGHSAIRVYDKNLELDLLFNYGTFDFDTPNFYMKFVRGKLKYQLSVSNNFGRFVDFYARQGRSVEAQILDLSLAQKQKLLNFLLENYKPENRKYLYDFFYDNCSTRVRDALQKALGEDLSFDLSKLPQEKTFKDLIDPYMEDPWVNLGIYLALGSPADAEASPKQTMFLPDHLRDGIAAASIRQGGKPKPLVKTYQEIVPKEKITKAPSFEVTPSIIFLLLFMFLSSLSVYDYLKRNKRYWIDATLLFILGAIGCFFILLWVGTDHQVLPYNYNMLWAFPPHIVVAFMLRRKSPNTFLKYYFLFNTLLLVFTLMAWFALPQRLHLSLIPLILLLILRSFILYKDKGAKPAYLPKL